jgi:hypothetical protein
VKKPKNKNKNLIQTALFLTMIGTGMASMANSIRWPVGKLTMQAIAFVLWFAAAFLFFGIQRKIWPMCKNLMKKTYIPCLRCISYFVGVTISVSIFGWLNKAILPVLHFFSAAPVLLLALGLLFQLPTLYQGGRRRLNQENLFPGLFYLMLFGFLSGLGVLFVMAFFYIAFGASKP